MKHAYLIIAHNEFELLKLLIDRIDDARNDIYIHIDQKTNTEGLELRAHHQFYQSITLVTQIHYEQLSNKHAS